MSVCVGIQVGCVSERQTCIFQRTSQQFHINAENIIKQSMLLCTSHKQVLHNPCKVHTIDNH